MGTIAEKLQAVKNSKAAIKLALENKGKTPGDTLADYADKVGELVAIDGLDGAAVSGAIPSKAAETIVPGTTDQIIAAGQYLAGNQTIQGDGNLLPENIRKGTSLFGVTGIMEPQQYETIIKEPETRYFSQLETIPAGTDVTYDGTVSENTTFLSGSPTECLDTYGGFGLFQLDYNKFLAIGEIVDGSLSACVYTFNGTTFSKGTPLVLCSTYSLSYFISCKIKKVGNYIAVFACFTDSSSYRIYVGTLSISNDVITVASSLIDYFSKTAAYGVAPVLISDNGAIFYFTGGHHLSYMFVKSNGVLTTKTVLNNVSSANSVDSSVRGVGRDSIAFAKAKNNYLHIAFYNSETDDPSSSRSRIYFYKFLLSNNAKTDTEKDSCTIVVDCGKTIPVTADMTEHYNYVYLSSSYYKNVIPIIKGDNVMMLAAKDKKIKLFYSSFSNNTSEMNEMVLAEFDKKIGMIGYQGNYQYTCPEETRFFAVNYAEVIDDANEKLTIKQILYQMIWEDEDDDSNLNLTVVPYAHIGTTQTTSTNYLETLKNTIDGFVFGQSPIYGNTFFVTRIVTSGGSSRSILSLAQLGNIKAAEAGGHVLGITEQEISPNNPGKITITSAA